MRQGFPRRLPGVGCLLALLAAALWLLKGDLNPGEASGEFRFRSEWIFLDVPGAPPCFVRTEPAEPLGQVLERKAPGLMCLLPQAALDLSLQGGDRVSVLECLASASRVLVVEPLPERVRFLMGRPLNLNRATADEMELLPAVGSKLGQRIEAFRNVAGEFRSLGDLLAVPGVGRTLVSKLQNRVCFAQKVWSFPLLSPESAADGRGSAPLEVSRTRP